MKNCVFCFEVNSYQFSYRTRSVTPTKFSGDQNDDQNIDIVIIYCKQYI